jgi:hypothetical protein
MGVRWETRRAAIAWSERSAQEPTLTSRADAVAPSTGIDLATAAAAAPQEVLKRLGSSDSGLSGTEAGDRLKPYGPNVVGLHRVRALAVLWSQLRNPLLLLLLVAAGVAQRVLQRHMPAERVAQHRPPLEAKPLAQRVGVRGQVLPGHRRNGRAFRPPVAPVVVEDQGEPVGALPERPHRPVIRPGPAMHEQQGVPMAGYLNVEGHIPDRDPPWPDLLIS